MQLPKYIHHELTNCVKRPVFFDLSEVAGLFFNDKAANMLLENNHVRIENLYTLDNQRANINISLTILTGEFTTPFEYFELKFLIFTASGTESLNIYDGIENLNINHLKKWMHIALCDEKRKMYLSTDLPENYDFTPWLTLPE